MVEKLNKDMIDAMKNKDKERLTIIRGIKAELKKKEIDEKIEINDNTLISVVSHQIKQLKESIKDFEKGARKDLIEKAEFEISVLEEYLPEPLTKSEVEGIISTAIEELEATTMKDMGKVMSEVKDKINGRFDMSEVSKMIREKLNK